MDKRTLNIVGAVGILCLGGFALAPSPVRSIPLGAGISTIHQAAIVNDPLVQGEEHGSTTGAPIAIQFCGRNPQGAKKNCGGKK